MNGLQQLSEAGQSVWLDNIRKGLLTTGELARYIDELYVTGVTSNPSILEKAIAGSTEYDEAMQAHLAAGTTAPEALVFELALEDLVAAADLLRPVFDATGGGDGYVSVEVSPDLAHDAAGTVAAGKALHAQAGRPNVLIKVPGTPEGLVAIEELVAAGIPVNVTLLFSASHYQAAAEAFIRGIERRRDAGQPLAVGSVASVFVSRWDSAADARLPDELDGKLGLAVVQECYAAYEELLASDRWRALSSEGALPQRLLFASTSTKDPRLPDTYYLGRLAAKDTIDTVPEPTLLAMADHGSVCDLLEPDREHALAVQATMREAGIDIDELAAELQAKGAEQFSQAWASLLQKIEEKAGALAGTGA
jgi:transaldolase